MRFWVTIGEREHEVSVQRTSAGGFQVSVDDAPFEGDVVIVPGGVNLLIDGRVIDVAVGGSAEAMDVAAGSTRLTAKVESERARAKKSRKRGAIGADKEIRAPMPGRIVKLLVEPGDHVTAGQALVIIEAMKMENEFRAAADAVVASVEVQEGQSVESQAILVRFE